MENLPQPHHEDPVGLETLEALSGADKFNEWMYQTIRPYAQGPVLEIGSGIGNISQFFLRDGFEITLTDLRGEYCGLLEEKFGDNPRLLGLEQIDLIDPNFEQKYASQLGKYNTVYALNVVEHIEDDALAIENCYKLLQKNGNLIILVPAYNWLYNNFDKLLGHYRRYNRRKLSKLFVQNNFKIIHRQYFNMAAMAGWFWYGKVLGKKVLPKGPVSTYNRLVPIFKFADKCVFNQIGNSVIVIGKKTED